MEIHFMLKKSQHVVPFFNGWAVKAEGRKTVSAITTRQSEAISIAKDLAMKLKGEVVVHGRNGKIREVNNYNKVPLPVKG